MLTAAEAAAALGLKPRTVYQLARQGLLACHRMGPAGGAVRFAPADVDAYLHKCRSAGTPATSAGALSLTASCTASGIDLAAYFRAAGVKPKLTPSIGKKPRACTHLHLASSSDSP